MPEVSRNAGTAVREYGNEGLNAGSVEHHDDPPVLVCERAEFLPQHRKKNALNMAPGV